MKNRSGCFVLVFAFISVAAAQDASAQSARDAMFRAASEIHESVSRGGGFVANMFGVDRAEMMILPLEDPERENWQFWPTARVGLPLEYMSAAERRVTQDLLAAALSSQGYLKAVHIMQLEQILDMLDEGGLPRSVDHYVLAIFGEPSESAPWAWRFEGHHVSLSVAVTPEGIAVTPSFFGSNPAQVRSGPLAGFRVHGRLEDLARDLVSSLDSRQRSQAVVGDRAPSEIATANMNKPRSEWNAWHDALDVVGVRVADLNEVQQHWVGLIFDEIVGNYQPEIQSVYREAVDIGSLSFAWMGSTERGEPHYFRLHGEDFLFEYDNVQNGGNHVHSVWRSESGDFGARLLQRHYEAAH
jgi:hypothetical protein